MSKLERLVSDFLQNDYTPFFEHVFGINIKFSACTFDSLREVIHNFLATISREFLSNEDNPFFFTHPSLYYKNGEKERNDEI